MVKWICAAVGLYLGGFLGAIAGYFLGAFIQGIMSGSKDNVFTSFITVSDEILQELVNMKR